MKSLGDAAIIDLRRMKSRIEALELAAKAALNYQIPATPHYLVVSPSGGIPERDGDIPGQALCRLVRRWGPSPKSLQESTQAVRVFHFGDDAIPAGETAIVHRDAWGDYWLQSGAASCDGLRPGVWPGTADETFGPHESGDVSVGEITVEAVNHSDCTIYAGGRVVVHVGSDCSVFAAPGCCCPPNLCDEPTDEITDELDDIDDWTTIISGGSVSAVSGVMRLTVGASPTNTISVGHVGDGTGNRALFVRSLPETFFMEITIDDFTKSSVGSLSSGKLTFSTGARGGGLIEYIDTEGSTPSWRPWFRSTGGTIVSGALSFPSVWRIEIELTSENPARGELRFYLDGDLKWSIGNQLLTLGSDDLLCWTQATLSLSGTRSPLTLAWPDVVADIDRFRFGSV